MATKTVTKEYPALPGKDVYIRKEFVGVDDDGKPIIEDIKLIKCPECGAALKVLQHPTTVDGLPFVACGDECPGGGFLTVIDYD